jgi:hypothetical protein
MLTIDEYLTTLLYHVLGEKARLWDYHNNLIDERGPWGVRGPSTVILARCVGMVSGKREQWAEEGAGWKQDIQSPLAC